MPNIIPSNFIGKTIGINEGPRRDKMFKITAQGAVEVDRKSVTGDILTVRPEELDYFQGIEGGKLSSSLNAAGYVSHEERLGTEASRAQYGDKFRDRPGLEPGVYTPEPYKAPTETYAMKFQKEKGRLPTPAEMEAAGQGTTQYPKEMVNQPPADLSKFYKPGLSDPQKQSIENLIKTGRVFNETDAKNYAYATGQSNWQQYVGKTGSQISGGGAPTGASGTPGATGAPGTPAPGDTTGQDTTVPKNTFDEMIKYLQGYQEPASFDKAAKRTELVAKENLQATADKVKGYDDKINALETTIRNRNMELREILKSRGATESEIQRELAGQLRPLQTQLNDLLTARNVESNFYNQGMNRVETALGDFETQAKEKQGSAQREQERLLKAYGLQVEQEAEQTKQTAVTKKATQEQANLDRKFEEDKRQFGLEYALKEKAKIIANTKDNYDVIKNTLEKSKGSDGFINSDVYKRERSVAKDKTGFDKNFSHLLNPNDPSAKQFMTSTQKTIDWGEPNPQTGKTPEQGFLDMGISQEMIDMAKSAGISPKDLF